MGHWETTFAHFITETSTRIMYVFFKKNSEKLLTQGVDLQVGMLVLRHTVPSLEMLK